MSSDWFTESLKEYKAIFVVHVSKSKISYVLTQVTCTEQEAKISGKKFCHLWSPYISYKYLECVEYTEENYEVYTGEYLVT